MQAPAPLAPAAPGSSPSQASLNNSLRPQRIYVAGHKGIVGSAICRALTNANQNTNNPVTLITRDRQALDLTLLGDPSKAKAKLGWTPIMTTQEMFAKMCEEDLKETKKEALLRKHEFNKAIPSEWSKSALSPELKNTYQ